jgi:hypothetical protein
MTHKRIIAAVNALTMAAMFTVTGIIPLAVHATVQPTPPELWDLVIYKNRVDFFAYTKSILLIYTALAITVCSLVRWILINISPIHTSRGSASFNFEGLWKHPVKFIKQPPVWAALLYLTAVIISGVLSPYPHTSVWGTVERFEGMLVQLSYIVIFLAVFHFTGEPKYKKAVLAGLIFSSTLMGIIGISQFLYHDFFATDIGNILVAGAPGRFTPVRGISFGTLANPNTYSLYTAMMAPFLLLLGFTYEGKGIINILLIFSGVLMAAGTPGSRSLSGFVGVMAACIFACICVVPIKKRRLTVLTAVIFFVTVEFLAFTFIPPGRGQRDILLSELQSEMAILTAAESNTPSAGNIKYRFENGSLELYNNAGVQARITAADKYLTIPNENTQAAESWLAISNGNGQAADLLSADLSVNGAQTRYVYAVEGYGNLSVIRRSAYFIIDGMNMSVSPDGKITPLQQNGAPIDISQPVRTIGFSGRELFGNLRGYIWSRTIPLVFDHLWIGSGPDSFINEFPQYDILGKKEHLHTPYQIVDKAHNLYLQTAVTTGGVSLLALLFLIGYFIIAGFISLIRTRSANQPAEYGSRLAVLAAICAFAVSSLATDSTIATTGVFWVLLGLGYRSIIGGNGYKSNT